MLNFASYPSGLLMACALLVNASVYAADGVDIAGTYASDITRGASSTWAFRVKKQREMQLVFKQSGDKITATNDKYDVKISGTRKGNTIEFYMEPSIVDSFVGVTGKWIASADGKSLAGTWELIGYEGTGKWNLTKIE